MVWWNWIKKALIGLGWDMEHREQVEFIEINDTHHLYIRYRWNGEVHVTLSPMEKSKNDNTCGFSVDSRGRVDYLGRTWTVIGSLDEENNQIVPRNLPEPDASIINGGVRSK